MKDPSEGNVNAVYRLDPNGKITQVLTWPKIHMPNGIATSSDNKTLYLIEAHPDTDHHRDIQVCNLLPDDTPRCKRNIMRRRFRSEEVLLTFFGIFETVFLI